MTLEYVEYHDSFFRKLNRKLRSMRAEFYTSIVDWILQKHPDCRDSNLVSYAEKELGIAGWKSPDSFYGDMMFKAVMRQLRLFSIEGHSGMSAGLATSIASSLCSYEPLSPLTGADDEWNECGDGVYQNRRASSVFKERGDPRAYRIDGKVFVDADGCSYTSRDSRVYIEFPYKWAKPEIVKATNSGA